MRKLVFLQLIGFVLIGNLLAQQDAKLDTVLHNQHKMLKNQALILNQTAWKDPLAGKHLGIEFNPALLLVGLGNEELYLSGGFSLFNLAPQAEIAFPVYYRKYNHDGSSLLTADVQYRLFFSKKRGFYASGGLRYARLHGEKDWWENGQDSRMVTIDKFGAFFGIGYRYFSEIGIYWGTSVIMGTYLSDDTDKIDGIYMDAGKFLFDIELLKIGFAF